MLIRFCWKRIPLVQDVQCAWALFFHSAVARANYQLRVVRPELIWAFAQGHDDGIWGDLRLYVCQAPNAFVCVTVWSISGPFRVHFGGSNWGHFGFNQHSNKNQYLDKNQQQDKNQCLDKMFFGQECSTDKNSRLDC